MKSEKLVTVMVWNFLLVEQQQEECGFPGDRIFAVNLAKLEQQQYNLAIE